MSSWRLLGKSEPHRRGLTGVTLGHRAVGKTLLQTNPWSWVEADTASRGCFMLLFQVTTNLSSNKHPGVSNTQSAQEIAHCPLTHLLTYSPGRNSDGYLCPWRADTMLAHFVGWWGTKGKPPASLKGKLRELRWRRSRKMWRSSLSMDASGVHL